MNNVGGMGGKVCISEASGFIGSNLQNILTKNGIDHHNWDRKQPQDFCSPCTLLYLDGRAHQMRDTAENPLSKLRKVTSIFTKIHLNED